MLGRGEKVHADWVNAFIDSLKELQTYIKKHHTTGVVWNAKVRLATVLWYVYMACVEHGVMVSML